MIFGEALALPSSCFIATDDEDIGSVGSGGE